MRKIVHIDMDCFFAAIECRDDPSVANLPVAVAHDSARGVLTTCNYVAREYGCRSAMPVFKARQLCPQLILKPIRFEIYRRDSRRIRQIFREYTDKVEPLSLDEAYLDLSEHDRFAWEVAREIRRRIWQTCELTASAGVAPNKMLAKIASDWRKPNGQFAVLPDEVAAFMLPLPVRKIPGIGPKAEARLHEESIETCGQLQELTLPELKARFGPAWAEELYERCRGIDNREVKPRQERKSLSVERTFERDISELEDCRSALASILQELEADWEKSAKRRDFRGIFVKLKFANFQSTTKEARVTEWNPAAFEPLLKEAFNRNPHAVRLIGAGLRFPEAHEPVPGQLELF